MLVETNEFQLATEELLVFTVPLICTLLATKVIAPVPLAVMLAPLVTFPPTLNNASARNWCKVKLLVVTEPTKYLSLSVIATESTENKLEPVILIALPVDNPCAIANILLSVVLILYRIIECVPVELGPSDSADTDATLNVAHN